MKDSTTKKQEILLFVSERSNNCSKQHRRFKTSYKQLPNFSLPIPVLAVEVVDIWTLQPITGYCHNHINNSEDGKEIETYTLLAQYFYFIKHLLATVINVNDISHVIYIFFILIATLTKDSSCICGSLLNVLCLPFKSTTGASVAPRTINNTNVKEDQGVQHKINWQ